MPSPTPPSELLEATEFLDHDSPVVRDFVARALPGDPAASTDVERARALYYAVRDGIQYEIYGADLSRAGLRASAVIERGSGFCVHKSLVYAAVLRSVGVPSRMFYADVRNHLASPQIERLIGGPVFTFHSLTSAYLDGKWVRATPVFNKLLCRLYKITPLDFDGRSDSISHPYDEAGSRYMEFLTEHGDFDDFPYELVVGGLRAAHPLLFTTPDRTAHGSLLADADADARP